MGTYNQTETTKYAESFLAQIRNMIKQETRSNPRAQGAIVTRVNNDGTVDVYLPPNTSSQFTRIQNQTKYDLAPGDSVEVYLKDGTWNNCWVFAKHGRSNVESDFGAVEE